MPLGRALSAFAQRFPDATGAVVAYSGGRDSHALLHAAVHALPVSLRAIHIAHGLQPAAEDWPAHCRATCESLGIPLEVIEAEVEPGSHGPEAAARDARYRSFEHSLTAGEVLLLAHHAQDQAETLLLRLMRGAGITGMAAMPESRALGDGHLWRPLLALPADWLLQYAQQHLLRWIEDPSNADTRFDRNYLRQCVLPSLRERWPQADRQLSSAARRAAEADELMRGLIQPLLADCCEADGSLDCLKIFNSDTPRQSALLRGWLQQYSALAPTELQLRAIVRDVVSARRDADPQFHLHGGSVRRHRGRLYWLSSALPTLPSRVDWEQPLDPLTVGEHTLDLSQGFGQQLAVSAQSVVQVRFREGGERIVLRSGERTLKKLLHDKRVPSWLRDRTPLLFVDGELAAVWNISVAKKYDKNYKNQ